MILFGLETYFALPTDDQCEDGGIAAMRQMGGDAAWFVTPLWLSLSLAFAGAESIVVAFARGRLLLAPKHVGKQYRVLPLLASVWAWSTLLSLLCLMLFGRQPVSLATKFVHVFSELTHLMYVLVLWKWDASGVAVLCLACVALTAALTMPCEIAATFTAIGGVLDTVNFVVCLFVRPEAGAERVAFRALRIAFLWHMTYIHAYLLMAYVVDPATTEAAPVALMRTYGVVANALAVYWTAVAVDALAFPADEAAAGTRGNAMQRAFAAVWALEIAPGRPLTLAEVLKEPVDGWAVPATVSCAVAASGALCSGGFVTTHVVEGVPDDARTYERRLGPLLLGRSIDVPLPPSRIVWRATPASLRRGRAVAWLVRLALARGLAQAGVYWLVGLAVGFGAPPLVFLAAAYAGVMGQAIAFGR